MRNWMVIANAARARVLEESGKPHVYTHIADLVHPQSRILGVVNKRTEEEWIQMIKSALDKYSPGGALHETKWQKFSAMLHMVPGDLSDDATYSNIANALQSFDGKKNALFYCAIPPQWYPRVTQGLHAAGLIDQGEGYRRIVIEKPFGYQNTVCHLSHRK